MRNIFNKNKKNNQTNQIRFQEARCPRCGGRLELDSNFEVAYCKDCGCQCVIQNTNKKPKDKFDKIISLIDRQQEIIRQDDKEAEDKENKERLIKQQDKENKIKRDKWWSKHWWKVLIFVESIIIALAIYQYLGSHNL